ncbi:MAG: hypothetical protein ACKVT0_21210 [Planctomycetaceae bacterium]
MPVLLIGSGEFDKRRIGSDMTLTNRDRCEFPPAESRRQQCFVNQVSFLPQSFQPFDRYGVQLGNRFAVMLPTTNGHRIPQRSFAGSGQQPGNFPFGQCPALTTFIRSLVCFRNSLERVQYQSPGGDAPVTERRQGAEIPVAGACPLTAILIGSQHPAFHDVGRQIGQPMKPAFTPQSVETITHIPPMFRGRLAAFEVYQVIIEMPIDRRLLMTGDFIFIRRHHVCLDQLTSAGQLTKYRPGGLFIPATGRDFLCDALAIAIFRQVCPRRRHDPKRTVLPFGDGCRACLSLRWFPLGEPFAVAGDDLGTRG